MDWIVGRKYLHKRTSLEYKCITMTSDNRPVMERKDNYGKYFVFDVLETLLELYTLIEEEKKPIGYVNIHSISPDCFFAGRFVQTRKKADDLARDSDSRIACVTVYEGDGL